MLVNHKLNIGGRVVVPVRTHARIFIHIAFGQAEVEPAQNSWTIFMWYLLVCCRCFWFCSVASVSFSREIVEYRNFRLFEIGYGQAHHFIHSFIRLIVNHLVSLKVVVRITVRKHSKWLLFRIDYSKLVILHTCRNYVRIEKKTRARTNTHTINQCINQSNGNICFFFVNCMEKIFSV